MIKVRIEKNTYVSNNIIEIFFDSQLKATPMISKCHMERHRRPMSHVNT